MRALSMDDEVMATGPDLSTVGELPAHARIAYWLERLIVSRELRVGDKLPPEVDIAAGLGVSRMTLRQALAAVEGKGLLTRHRGRFGGNFVAEPRFDFNLSGLPGFTEQMRRAHVEAGAYVVQAATRAPSAPVRAALRLRRGEQVHEIIRVRSANGDPITLEEGYFPAGVYPDMLQRDLQGSLYRVMERDYGVPPATADEVIEPVKATAQQAELLHVPPESSLLLITRTSFAADGEPVEFSRDWFRPDRTRIVLRTQADRSTQISTETTERPTGE